MKPRDYLKESEAIHAKVEQLYSEFKAFSPSEELRMYNYRPVYQLALKFVHLVYSFDPNLPLNREIQDVPKECKGYISVSGILDHSVLDDFIFYLDFFHSYLVEEDHRHQSPD